MLAWKSQSFLILCIILLLLAGVAFDFHMAERDTERLHQVYSAGASLFQGGNVVSVQNLSSHIGPSVTFVDSFSAIFSFE